MVAFNHEPKMTVVAIKSKHRNTGIYIAILPDSLEADDIDAALRKMKLDPIRVCPLENWVEAENGMSVVFLPDMGTD